MESKFKRDFEVTFFETDINKKLAPGYLLAFFQDTAIGHSASLGYGIDRLLKEKRGWAILNWHIVINRMPGREKVDIKTWCGKCRRLQAERSFTAEGTDGELLAYAVTNWAFMDLDKRRPSIIPSDMEEVFKSDIPSVIENEKYRIRRPQEEEFTYGDSFVVTRSDLDTNDHVNNTRYLVWAADCVDDDIYYDHDLTDIKVTYRKEAKKGDEIISKKAVYYNDNEVETVVYFVNKNDPGVIFAQISMIWKNN